MNIFDRYIFKNLFIATFFIAVTLAVVIFLTQSLRFLELVIESGASSGAFWVLTLLALPRFFEIILPLSLMAATLFIYNRMTSDSELVVVRATGYAPFALARPALMLSMMAALFLLAVTLWVAPKSISMMQEKREMIKAQFSTLLFREGVFNKVGNGLTVYVRARGQDGALSGLMIHDSRDPKVPPSTILAQRGALVSTAQGYQVVVYEGSRQEYDSDKGVLKRLDFNRYTIDLPESDPVRQRWAEPDERTIGELLNPDRQVKRDLESIRDFQVEVHRRVVSPLLAVVFTLIACAFLLIGPVGRRGQTQRIVMAAVSVVVIQGLYIAAYNMARQSNAGLVFMYMLVLLPMGTCIFALSGVSDAWRRRFLYQWRRGAV
ncbi:MAG: LPS export ABC transporter permease LptF [Rhodospirillales bacterium]|nr:LPS export ABC transporter permease LptF [Rhodospirillales bacterium]